MPCIAVHYPEDIKINANKPGLLLRFSSTKKKHVFSTATSLIFPKALQVQLWLPLRFITAYYECKR